MRLTGERCSTIPPASRGSQDGFIAASGESRVVRFVGDEARNLAVSDLKYDNHIRRL
jgi:hypothetical protein